MSSLPTLDTNNKTITVLLSEIEQIETDSIGTELQFVMAKVGPDESIVALSDLKKTLLSQKGVIYPSLRIVKRTPYNGKKTRHEKKMEKKAMRKILNTKP